MDPETASRRGADQTAGGGLTPLPPTAEHDPWRAGWIEDERRFRDEGTVFGLAESDAAVASKEESIRHYFAAWRARSEAKRRDLVEWAAELRRRHAEAWSRIEALERTLAATGVGPAGAQADAVAPAGPAPCADAGPARTADFPTVAAVPGPNGGEREHAVAPGSDPVSYHKRYAPSGAELSIEPASDAGAAADSQPALEDRPSPPLPLTSDTGAAVVRSSESHAAPGVTAAPRGSEEPGRDAVDRGDPGGMDGSLPRLVSAIALTLAICALNYVLVLELLKGVFERPALVAAGVVLAGFFTLFAPRSLFGADSEDAPDAADPDPWRPRLAEVGLPVTAALFVAVWAVPTLPAGIFGRVVLFLFLAAVFFFVSKLLLRLAPDSAPTAGRAVAAQRARWRARAERRRLRRAARTERDRLMADRERLFARANLLEAEIMHTGERMRALAGPAEIEAMRDHRLALFRSELELARLTGRSDDARATDRTEEVPHESL